MHIAQIIGICLHVGKPATHQHTYTYQLQSADSRQKRNRAESDEAPVQAELQHNCRQGSAQQTDPPCRLSDEQWLSVKGTVQSVKVAALIPFSGF